MAPAMAAPPASSPSALTIDEAKLDAFIGQAVSDVGAAMSATLVVIGDKLGLYQALHRHGPMTSAELAERTDTHERYVREWLANQAAGGYLTYDTVTDRYTLPPEQAALLADETSPLFVHGLYQIIQAMSADEAHITQAFRTGRGFGWHEHDERLFIGTERFFRPGYNAHLVSSWIPALEGVETRLREGASVADVGCGLGASTILMARAYPRSTFVGFDYHAKSIELARERAEAAGMADRITFEVATAKTFPGQGYDLVTCFDCLHDMGDPVGAARHVRDALTADGTWMIVEPFAHDRVDQNFNPVGRLYYAASTILCTPSSLSQEVGLALGAQAGERRISAVIREAGFARFRRAAETPFNLVFEARP
jgi:2-polyprenyl-3-methyl-5-hydroxy-6-metoxy-1,4-benzoquinol methylase